MGKAYDAQSVDLLGLKSVLKKERISLIPFSSQPLLVISMPDDKLDRV
jgi:hypothetical protein